VIEYAFEGSNSAKGRLADDDQDYHPERPTLAIFATQDISAGEELCISYIGTVSLESTLLLLVPCTTGVCSCGLHTAKRAGSHLLRHTKLTYQDHLDDDPDADPIALAPAAAPISPARAKGKGRANGKQEPVAASVHLVDKAQSDKECRWYVSFLLSPSKRSGLGPRR
jgi:hypothetical protein